FLWARVLRIYPALLVMMSLVVFGLGLYFTTLPHSQYFTDPRTFKFAVQNSTLFSGVMDIRLVQQLPGVFADNPMPLIVNGSLWSMPYEVRMYLSLAVLWIVARLAGERRFRVFEYALVSIALIAGVSKLVGYS